MSVVSNFCFSHGVRHSNVLSAVMLCMSAKYWHASNHVKSGAPVWAHNMPLFSFNPLMACISAGFCWGLWGVVSSAWHNQSCIWVSHPSPQHCILELSLCCTVGSILLWQNHSMSLVLHFWFASHICLCSVRWNPSILGCSCVLQLP